MYTLMNGVQLNRKYPDTFEIPSEREKQGIKPGDFVKIGASFKGGPFAAERFWVIVDARDGETLTGTINNDLIGTPYHGLKDGMSVKFETKNVLAILPPVPQKPGVDQVCGSCN